MSNRIDDLYNVPSIKAQAEQVFALMDETVRRIQALNAMNINMNFGGGNGRSGGNGGGASQAVDALTRATERLNMAQSQLGQQIATVNEQTRQQNVVNRQNAQASLAQNGSLNALRASLNQLTRQYDNLSAAERNNVSVGRTMVRNIQDLQREIRTLEAETGRMQRNVGNYPQQLVGGLQNIAGSFGLVTGIGAIGATAKAVFDTSVKLDSLNYALKAVSGSEQEFAVNQKFLLDISERLGLNILSISEAYKLFYSASTQAGLSADETRRIFTSVTETSATLKLSQEDTNGVLLAFSQILGKGKVQAEELRGQIGERVPGAFAIAARAIGVTQQQLDKMLQQGQLIAKDFLPKFATELEKTFGNGGARVEGLQASINRLSNTFTSLVADNQSGLTSFFGSIIDLAGTAIKVVNNLAEAGGFLYNVFADPAKNRALIESMAFKQIAQDISDAQKVDAATLLEQRNNIDKNIESYNKLLESQKVAADQAYKSITATNQNSKEYEMYQKAIADTEAQLKSLIKTRAIYVAELKKRYPGNGDGEDQAAKALTDKQLKEASRLREMQLKAALEANKITVQDAIDSQKLIIDNDKFTVYERLQALSTYNELSKRLIEDNAKEERRILKENIFQKQAVAEQGAVIDNKEASAKIKLTRDTQNLQAGIIKSGDDKDLAKIVAKGEEVQKKLEANAIKELEQAKKLHDQELISDGQYNDLKAQIENKYQVESLKSEAEYVQKIIELRQLRGENVADDQLKLLDIQNKINKLGLIDFTKTEKEKTKAAEAEEKLRYRAMKAFNKQAGDLAQELSNFVVSSIQNGYEKQKAIIEQQLKDTEDKKNKDIEAVQKSTASEQDKADKIAVINARAAADTEKLNERKRQIEMQQARFDKAKSAASIVQNTATAVIRAFADFPFYIALPLSILIGATGAAQLATTLATPLPHYKDGIDYSPEGLAVVGDGGRREVIETKYGTYLTPDTDTLTYLPAGSRVHKSEQDYYNSIGSIAHSRLYINPSGELSMEKVRGEVARIGYNIVDAVRNNKSITNVVSTFSGLKVTHETTTSFINYLDKNVTT